MSNLTLSSLPRSYHVVSRHRRAAVKNQIWMLEEEINVMVTDVDSKAGFDDGPCNALMQLLKHPLPGLERAPDYG